MLSTFRTRLLMVMALGTVTVPGAFGQAPGAPAGANGPPGAPAGMRQQTLPPGWNDVVATIASGGLTEKVTKGDVIEFLRNYPIPNDEPQAIYREAVERVVNTKLLLMFLTRQKIVVPPARIDEQIEQLKQQLKSGGQDLATMLLQNSMSMDELRQRFEVRLRWSEFQQAKATEATLRKHLAERRTSSATPRFAPVTSC